MQHPKPTDSETDRGALTDKGEDAHPNEAVTERHMVGSVANNREQVKVCACVATEWVGAVANTQKELDYYLRWR